VVAESIPEPSVAIAEILYSSVVRSILECRADDHGLYLLTISRQQTDNLVGCQLLRVDLVALRVSGSKCRVAVTSGKDGACQVSHVFCESKLYGVKCRLDGIDGRKPYVLCAECFQPADCSKRRK
jgi:hypothetical protein